MTTEDVNKEEMGEESPDPKDLARKSRAAITRIREDLGKLSGHLQEGESESAEQGSPEA